MSTSLFRSFSRMRPVTLQLGVWARPMPRVQNYSTLSPETIAIVKSTAPVMDEHGYTITTSMYESMFANNAHVKTLFNQGHQIEKDGKRAQQPTSLAKAVAAYAHNIDNLGALGPAVEKIAQKHCGLQILPEHYSVVGTELLDAVKRVLGDAATPAIMEAWGEAYWFLANLLIGREEAIYAEVAGSGGGWRGWKDMVVVKKVQESENVVSFYFDRKDVEGKSLGVPVHKPGQFVGLRFNVPGVGEIQRNYSISSTPGSEHLRISVKREDAPNPSVPAGVGSSYLHDNVNEGDTLQVCAPYGDFFLTFENDDPIVLVVKQENVSLSKTLVLQDVTGKITDNREDVCKRLGVKANASRFKIAPKNIPLGYKLYVLTTSYNRKIKKGQMILVKDHAESSEENEENKEKKERKEGEEPSNGKRIRKNENVGSGSSSNQVKKKQKLSDPSIPTVQSPNLPLSPLTPIRNILHTITPTYNSNKGDEGGGDEVEVGSGDFNILPNDMLRLVLAFVRPADYEVRPIEYGDVFYGWEPFHAPVSEEEQVAGSVCQRFARLIHGKSVWSKVHVNLYLKGEVDKWESRTVHIGSGGRKPIVPPLPKIEVARLDINYLKSHQQDITHLNLEIEETINKNSLELEREVISCVGGMMNLQHLILHGWNLGAPNPIFQPPTDLDRKLTSERDARGRELFDVLCETFAEGRVCHITYLTIDNSKFLSAHSLFRFLAHIRPNLTHITLNSLITNLNVHEFLDALVLGSHHSLVHFSCNAYIRHTPFYEKLVYYFPNLTSIHTPSVLCSPTPLLKYRQLEELALARYSEQEEECVSELERRTTAYFYQPDKCCEVTFGFEYRPKYRNGWYDWEKDYGTVNIFMTNDLHCDSYRGSELHWPTLKNQSECDFLWSVGKVKREQVHETLEKLGLDYDPDIEVCDWDD